MTQKSHARPNRPLNGGGAAGTQAPPKKGRTSRLANPGAHASDSAWCRHVKQRATLGTGEVVGRGSFSWPRSPSSVQSRNARDLESSFSLPRPL